MTPEEFLTDPGRLGLVGLLGFLVLAFMRGWIVPGWAYKERDDEAEYQREQRDALVQIFQDEVVPTLTRSTDALVQATKVLESQIRNGHG